MKHVAKGSIIGVFCLVLFTSIVNVTALSLIGHWGFEEGNSLIYTLTDNRAESSSQLYVQYTVTSIQNVSTTIGGNPTVYNVSRVNGTMSIFNQASKQWDVATQVGQPGKVIIAMGNETTGFWHCAMLFEYQPVPAPRAWSISEINDTIAGAFATAAPQWGVVTSAIDGQTITYSNGTDTLEVAYGTGNICTLLRHRTGADVVLSLDYLADFDPIPHPAAGTDATTAIAAISVTTVAVVLRIRSRAKH